MVLVSTFFLQLLCSVVSCNHRFEYPSDPLQTRSRTSKIFNEFEEYPVVNTSVGAVRGYTMRTIKSRHIYAFEGVPFAETTAGENRFQPPVPKKKWNGIRNAFKFGSICLQANPLRVVLPIQGSEDCLFLNIYTHPAIGQSEKLPVLVWIHGGSYFYGSGSDTGPAYLLEHDVILVTFNYRLGILGFLSTGDDLVPGNNGLKDQALAIKWVYENIDKFGGDPTKITLMGQSAGASSVNYHMMSEMSQPYFSAGILMSGSALHSWAFRGGKILKMLNQKLAKESRCSDYNSRAFYDCLRRINPYFLTGMQLRMFPVNFIRIILFGPVDEKLSENSTQVPFITQHPEELYNSGSVAKVPVIFSKTSGEADIPSLISDGYGILGEAVFKLFWQGSETGLLELLFSDKPWEKRKLIDDHYFSGRNLVDLEVKVFDNIITDRFHGVGTHKAIQRQSQVSTTYALLISGSIKHGLAASIIGAPQGSTLIHADDVFLIFNGTEVIEPLKTTDTDFALTEILTEAISHFAKYRTTNFPRKSEVYEDWKAVTDPCDIQYYNVTLDRAKMTSLPKTTVRNYLFWQNLGLIDTLPNPYNC